MTNRRMLTPVELLACAVCAGCAMTPPPPQPLELPAGMPEQWLAAAGADGSVDHLWWKRFGDPELDTLVTEALTANRDLRAASARVDAAGIEARIAGAALYPTLHANLDAARSKRNFIGFPIPGGGSRVLSTTTTTWGASLTTTWEVDLWGRVRAEQSAAAGQFEAAAADYAFLAQSLAGQVARAWFALREARLQVELAGRTVETYSRTTEQARRRFEGGTRPSLDLRLAESDLAAAQALLEARREQYERATRLLEILLGRYPAGAVASAGDLPDPGGAIPIGLPAELLTRRPDLIAAERRLAAQDQRIAAAVAALYPRLALTATAGTSTQEFTDLLDPDFFVWSIVGGLAQPVFEGGRLQGEVDLARARAEALVHDYAAVALAAFGEVEAALAAEALLAQRETHLRRASQAAAAALQSAEDRYGRGLDELALLLDAQRRSLTADSALLAVQRERLDVRIDLHLALGGGFESPLADSPAGRPFAGGEEGEE